MKFSNIQRKIAANMILLQTVILAFAFYGSGFTNSGASAAAQDHVETNIELIPDVTEDEEGLSPKATHQQHHLPTKAPGSHTDRLPPQTELQHVLQFIEEKFLSFTALHVRPNFANVFRHMERINRAFVKLSTRVDSVHAQLEDMSNHQQNCSSHQQVTVFMNTVTTRLNELDRKIDHLERQVQYPPSYGLTKNLESMGGQLRHIQESLEHMERTNIQFATEGLRRHTPAHTHMSKDFDTIANKLDAMQNTLGEIASVKHTANTELQFNAVLAQGLDRKLDDLAQVMLEHTGTLHQHLHNATHTGKAKVTSPHFIALLEQQHNATKNLLMQLAESQGPTPTVQHQLEKLPDLLKIVQDLPGVTTDAMDRAEVMFARIQDKIEGIHIHTSANQQTMSKLETNFEEILDKIDQIAADPKQTVEDTDTHNIMVQTQAVRLASTSFPVSDNLSFANSHQLTNTSDAGTLPMLTPLMQKLDEKFKDLHAICQHKFEREQGTATKLHNQIDKIEHASSQHGNQRTQQNESNFITSTLQRIDMTSNNTQDKLDYITSTMATFQADHSLMSFSLEEVVRQVGKLQQKVDEVLQETEMLKLAKMHKDTHLPNSTERLQADVQKANVSNQFMSEKMYSVLLHIQAKIDNLHTVHHEKQTVTNHEVMIQNTTVKQDSRNTADSKTTRTYESNSSPDIDNTYYEAVIKHLMQLQAIIDKLSTAMSEREPPITTCSSKDWELKIERILTHNKHNLEHLLKQIPAFNGTAAATIAALMKIDGDIITLTTNEELELKEAKKISERIDTLHAKVDLINNDSLGRVMRLVNVGERSKNGSKSWELTTTAMLQTIYDRVAAVDADANKIKTAIQEGMDNLLEKIKLTSSDTTINLHRLHPMERTLTHLSTHKDNHTTNDQLTDDYDTTHNQDSDHMPWRHNSDTTYALQSMLDDKLDKMKINVQNIVDNGVFQFVDFIGQQKLMMQQSMSTFMHQQNENVAKMIEKLATRITKGFDDIHFMYQLISGKMDKVYHISAHNLEDCADVQKSGHTQSGVYTIYPRNSKELRVFCDMETEGGGWTVIQRRGDYGEEHRTTFNQTWIDYKYGFGNLEREFWMGNENIHVLTSQGNYILRIDLLYAEPDPKLPRHRRKIWHNLKNTSRLYAQYNHFHVQSEHHNYTMTHKGYKGIHPHDGLEGRSGHAFTTWDHAANVNLQHCAKIQGGGWWYGVECFRFALNSKHKHHYWEDGNLFTGITWGGTADIALLKHVEMKILPHLAHKKHSEHIPSAQ